MRKRKKYIITNVTLYCASYRNKQIFIAASRGNRFKTDRCIEIS